MEIERLTQLLEEWAEFESAREPFSVSQTEAELPVSIGGIELKARIDRLDSLPGGGQIIIDYKTTASSLSAWEGPRPDEPQVPLYAVASTEPVAAVALAQFGGDGYKFVGIADRDGLIPNVKVPNGRSNLLPLTEQIGHWRTALTVLAQDFANGDAVVNPKKSATCERCDLHALCRIREFKALDDNGDSDAGA
jgi:ATP-dependent helicase/DNAse subunit B